MDETKKRFNKDKKTIVFVNPFITHMSGNELEKRPVGGSETAIINMTRLFAEDYNVHVFSVCEPGVYDNVIYHDILSLKPDDFKQFSCLDVVILCRWVPFLNQVDFKKYGAKKVIIWAEDKADDPLWEGIVNHLDKIDWIYAVSKWHKEDISKEHGVPLDKIKITSNGVNSDLFSSNILKIPSKCIYSSTPFRGLDLLLDFWPEIRNKIPEAELYVFSSMKIYGATAEGEDSKYSNLYAKAKQLKGVHYLGSVKQDVLAKHMQEAELLIYPNTFPETNCITVMEAQTAGTPIVTSDKAALTETVPDKCGYRIGGDPYSKEYKKKFIESCVLLLTDDDVWKSMHEECLKHDYGWDKVIGQWKKDLFRESLGSKKEQEIDEELV